jgi:hypothetical protein
MTFWRGRDAKAFHARYFADEPVELSQLPTFRGENFPASGPLCWLDQPHAFGLIDQKLQRGEIDETEAEICRKWVVDGYYIAEKLIDAETLDTTWAAYQSALDAGRLGPVLEGRDGNDPYPERKLDPHLIVPEVAALQAHPAIRRLTDLFFGRKTVPFQTIMGHKGSQQAAHSDAIHMTTYPLGYLVANWIAFEDIHADSGPLVYYPKSHRLPYLLSAEVGIPAGSFEKNGYKVYHERYEPMIASHCQKYGLEKRTFVAAKGDVLFWHSNLIHGGSPRADYAYTRKALVCHYFAQGAVTYHDLSGVPTRLHKKGMYRPIREDRSRRPIKAGV